MRVVKQNNATQNIKYISYNRCLEINGTLPFSLEKSAAFSPLLHKLPGRETPLRQAACTISPLTIKPPAPALTSTVSPSPILPSRINPASGFCSSRWITRLSGRAP